MRRLEIDRLPEALEVLFVEDQGFGAGSEDGPRPPHRHDYHEVIWTRAGKGRHLVDDEHIPVDPGTLMLIGRGQVHVFEHATGLTGAVVRFGEEVLPRGGGWLVGSRGARVVHVPPSEQPALEALLRALGAEVLRPPDARTPDLQRHLLSVLLLWFERWYDAARAGTRTPQDADVQLYRRFAQLLERDYARRHDTGHYAEALGVPASALSKALASVTGRTTKELITDRVMLEAARLLRYTDLGVGEIAFRVGFEDQLYFSRAFRKHAGASPAKYRAAARGRPAE